MKPLLIVPLLFLVLACGCKRECNCPVDCGTGVVPGGTPAAIAPMPAPALGATAAAGATTPAGSTLATGATAAPAAGSTASVPAPEKEYCASESGDVFHRCSCTSVKRIKPGKLVRIPSRAAATASGRRACKHCKP